MPRKDIVAESWEQFVYGARLANVGLPFSGGYLFRGQAVSDWTLRTSLLRVVSGFSPVQAIELERHAAAAFSRQSHLYISAEPKECVERWTYMQHYGIPTRVLDWTASPYVAAFFAVKDHPESDGAIWVVQSAHANEHYYPAIKPGIIPQAFADCPTREEVDQRFLENGRPDIFFFSPEVMHERLAAQQGWFSVSRDVLSDHCSPLDAIPSSTAGDIFVKIVIPKALKRDFYLYLLSAGITERTLFPGIDGFGRSIATMMHMHRPMAHPAVVAGA